MIFGYSGQEEGEGEEKEKRKRKGKNRGRKNVGRSDDRRYLRRKE